MFLFQASYVRILERVGPSAPALGSPNPGTSVPAGAVPLHLLSTAHHGQFHGRAPGVWASPVRPGHVWRSRLRVALGKGQLQF